MVTFPESVICILEDNYQNTANVKLYHGKKSKLLSPVIDVIFHFRNYEAVQAMYLFYSQILNNTTNPFLINLPIFGFEDRYIVRLESPMSWTSIAGSTGQMRAKLRIVTPLEALSDADYEMDVNVLEDKREEDVEYWIETSGGGTIYALGDEGYHKYDLVDGGQHIYAKGSNRFYGFGITRFKIEPNSQVHDVYIYKNELQVDAYNMFKKNYELVSIKANGYTFAKADRFESFADTCEKLEYIDSFDTSSGTNFKYMFNHCDVLTEVPYYDVTNGTSFYYFIAYCDKLEKVSPLNFSSATYMGSAFYEIGRGTENGTLIQNVINLPECTNITDMLRHSKIQNDIEIIAPKVTNAQYAFAQTTFKKVEVTFDESVDCKEAFWSSHFDALKIVANKAFDNVYYMFNHIGTSCIKGKLWTNEDTYSKEYMFGNADSITTPDQATQDDLTDSDGAVWENDTCS